MQDPFKGLDALKTVSVQVVATKAGPPPNLVPTVQNATLAGLVVFKMEQVDFVQLGEAAGVTPGVQTLLR